MFIKLYRLFIYTAGNGLLGEADSETLENAMDDTPITSFLLKDGYETYSRDFNNMLGYVSCSFYTENPSSTCILDLTNIGYKSLSVNYPNKDVLVISNVRWSENSVISKDYFAMTVGTIRREIDRYVPKLYDFLKSVRKLHI